eukprot:1197650-Amphidinium_carterae.2
MATSRVTDEAIATAWSLALQEGHRCLRIAEKLLSRTWVAPCPLPLDVGGAVAQSAAEEHERYTDLLVIALHWAGVPDTPPTSALLGIPEAASHGITDTLAVEEECWLPDGSPAENTSLVVVLASVEYLARILCDSTPFDAEVVTFLTDAPEAAPSGSSLFSTLAMPDALSSG